MSLTKGPEDLVCSARGCEKGAQWAVAWSNPRIHHGRHKTWLACEEHREFLHEYLAVRNFPVTDYEIEDFMAQESGDEGA